MMSHGGWLDTSIQTIMDVRTPEENYTKKLIIESLKAIGLVIYTTKATINFLKFREAWLPSRDQLVFNYHWLGCQ